MGEMRMRLSIAINTAMPVTIETPQRESLPVVMVTVQRTQSASVHSEKSALGKNQCTRVLVCGGLEN